MMRRMGILIRGVILTILPSCYFFFLCMLSKNYIDKELKNRL